jgi:para-nitrobenzyl esterase
MDRIIETTHGRIRTSEAAKGVLAYRGIPYAAPPFGPNRLRAPAPARAWDGVRDCIAFGSIPPQPAVFPGMPQWSPQDSKDVLTVNVFVPERADGVLPVLVWIYGGAYRFGNSADYDATALVNAGQIVVTFNYRVHFEGFGHVPGRPDNRGLLDQIAALRWVRDNIAAFGGDPDNVTIAGESAGAGSVICMMVMPGARGLFRRAIAHSVPSELFSVNHARRITERIAETAGVVPSAEALDAVPPEALINASETAMAAIKEERVDSIRHYAPTIFNPVVDGSTLPEAPLAGFAAGRARDVDLLACHTLHEFRFFPVIGAAPRVASEPALLAAAAAFHFPVQSLPAYRALSPDEGIHDIYTALGTDRLFGEYTSRLAEQHARAGGRSYLSRFAWPSPVLGGMLRACHILDVAFVFGQLETGAAAMLVGGQAGPEEHALSRRMIRAWSDFAAGGEPGWPAIVGDITPVQIWNREDDLVNDDRSGCRALWKEVTFDVD